MPQKLSLDIAKKIAQVAENKALELGIKIVISLFDHHGNMKYFSRMDETSYGSIRVSEFKAKTAASFPLSSKALADRSATLPTNPYGVIPDILLLGGGLPILIKTKFI